MKPLDRLIGKYFSMGGRRSRGLIESGKVLVNGEAIFDPKFLVGKFDHVLADEVVLQNRVRKVVLLHKPSGVVSATSDTQHKTVIDLIDEPYASDLHLAGRLDRFTTGLVILTNDSQLSESLSSPGAKVGKRYDVTVDGLITDEIVADFREGLWFAKEKVKTEGALVTVLSAKKVRLTIYEGKHHQIKRMFARYQLKVTQLHREAIGDCELPSDLKPGQWRETLFFDRDQESSMV